MIDSVMLWNEPNNLSHWDFQIDPQWRTFAALVRAAGTAVRAESPVAPDYPFAERDVFEHPAWPKLHFVERRYANDETNWWIPNRACAEAMLRSSGFAPTPIAGSEVYLCRLAEPDPLAGPIHAAPPPGGAP